MGALPRRGDYELGGIWEGVNAVVMYGGFVFFPLIRARCLRYRC